jgi:hypothetical protein
MPSGALALAPTRSSWPGCPGGMARVSSPERSRVSRPMALTAPIRPWSTPVLIEV